MTVDGVSEDGLGVTGLVNEEQRKARIRCTETGQAECRKVRLFGTHKAEFPVYRIRVKYVGRWK